MIVKAVPAIKVEGETPTEPVTLVIPVFVVVDPAKQHNLLLYQVFWY